MYFQVSSSNTFIQPNEKTEIIPSQTLREKTDVSRFLMEKSFGRKVVTQILETKAIYFILFILHLQI